MTMITEKIEQYIIENKLNVCGRHRELVYKKMYLGSLLRANGYTLLRIGKLFNRGHATVLHWIRTHEGFIQTNDKIYADLISVEKRIFEPSVEIKRDLVKDILECNNTTQLTIIKNRITKGEY